MNKDRGGRAIIEGPNWKPCPTAAVDKDASTMRMSLVLNAWAYIWGMTPKSGEMPDNAASPNDTFYTRVRQLVSHLNLLAK